MWSSWVFFNINLAFPLRNSSVDLLTIMSGSNLYPSITIPTRVTESTHSLIDKIFSTLRPAKVSVITSDTSDHFPIHTVFNTARKPTPLVRTNQGLQVINLKEENLKLLNDELKKSFLGQCPSKWRCERRFWNFPQCVCSCI